DGRHRYLSHLSRRTPLEGAGAENVDGRGLRARCSGIWSSAYSARHLKNSRYAYLEPLLHSCIGGMFCNSALDLLRQEADRLGLLCPACWLKYSAHLSASGFLLLHHRCSRYHLFRNPFQLWVARSRQIDCIHRIDSMHCSASHPVEDTSAVVNYRFSFLKIERGMVRMISMISAQIGGT